MPRLPLLLVLLSGLLSSLPLHADGSLRDANQAVVDQHIVPRYRQLAAATEELVGQADALCRAPDAAQLARLRDSYGKASDAWQGIQHLRFGPVELLLRYHRYQLWPDKRNTGAKQLGQLLAAQDPALLTPERFARSSVAVQGFSALERLLFDNDAQPVAFTGYRCQLTRAVARNLADMSAEIVADWTAGDSPYRSVLLRAGPGNAYFESDREVSSRLLNNLDTQLQVIIEQKLLRPLGNDIGEARVRRAEAWRSRRSLHNVAVNLQALQQLYRTGYAPLLRASADGVRLDRQLRDAFATALVAAKGVDAPLVEIAKDPTRRPALQGLLTRCRQLKQLVSGPLPQALDVPLGFNSLDGD